MSGTEWTGPSEGSTAKELYLAFHAAQHRYDYGRAIASLSAAKYEDTSGLSTNLQLTGAPITEEDWARLESEQFQVGGQS